MYIKKIVINGFGKLIDKTIEFKNGIILLEGKNETGKSTIVDFIKFMIYGISKNKGSKEQSDFERYCPWESGKFGGTLELFNNGRVITIYRDFNNNICKVTDEEGNDVSREFDISKTKGIDVGMSELKVDQDTFENVFTVKQKQVSLGFEKQKVLVQKMINYLQSGDEDFSYNEVKNKLEKALNDEIGTDRTTTKPKYVLSNEIKKLEDDLKSIKEKKRELDIKYQEKKQSQSKLKDVKEHLNKLKTVLAKKKHLYQELTDEKIKYEAKVEALKEKEKETKKKNAINKTIDVAMIIVSTIILVIALVLLKKYVFLPFIIILMIVCCALNNKLLYKESFDYGEEEFKNKIQSIRDKEAYEMNELIKTGIDKCITEKTTSELNDMITNMEEEYKQLTLNNHELELQCSMISKDVEMENLISTELSNKKVELTRLLDKEKMLKLSLAKLEEASGEIRKRIVPEFEKSIGEALSLITNDKYKSIKYVNDKGLIVKNQLGNNVSTHSLSVGTVDQIYIAFRLALCKKYEDIPIVFDESFTYADDERLCEILKNINMLSANKQIIIISCTNREEKIMDENQIKYHKINI